MRQSTTKDPTFLYFKKLLKTLKVSNDLDFPLKKFSRFRAYPWHYSNRPVTKSTPMELSRYVLFNTFFCVFCTSLTPGCKIGFWIWSGLSWAGRSFVPDQKSDRIRPWFATTLKFNPNFNPLPRKGHLPSSHLLSRLPHLASSLTLLSNLAGLILVKDTKTFAKSFHFVRNWQNLVDQTNKLSFTSYQRYLIDLRFTGFLLSNRRVLRPCWQNSQPIDIY